MVFRFSVSSLILSNRQLRERYPGADALKNLDDWNAFEADNLQTFF
jgi:hypothetical protein